MTLTKPESDCLRDGLFHPETNRHAHLRVALLVFSLAGIAAAHLF